MPNPDVQSRETPRPKSRARLIQAAVSLGALPEVVTAGMHFRRVGMLGFDGKRSKLVTARDHTRIEILNTPGGRRTRYSYVKLDAKGMGNGRADRQVHRCDRSFLARHYEVEFTRAL